MKHTLSVDLDQVKKLFHYFGYEVTSISRGVWAFQHKSMRGNTCIVTASSRPPLQKSPLPWIAKLEFFGVANGKSKRINISRPKTWLGIFVTLRNHTRHQLFVSEIQLKQAA